MFRKIFHWLKPFVRNYYLMTGVAFVVWMIFFDSNNAITQYESMQELKELERQRDIYVKAIAENKEIIKALTDSKDLRAAEKYARENYMMKKEGEEIFLIVKE